MYGADSYGTVPYGDTGFSLDDLVDPLAMLDEPRADIVYTVEILARDIDADTEVRKYFASTEWETAPDDVPASQPFAGLLTSYNLRRSIAGNGRFSGMATCEGSVVLANGDGALDAFLDDFGLDGRKIIVRFGRKGDPLKDHLVLVHGVIEDVDDDGDELRISITDESKLLDVPAQPETYLGTGGAEGTEDIAGKRRPKVFGSSYSVPLVLVDPTLLIYNVSSTTTGTIQAGVGGLRDKGATLGYASGVSTYAALEAATPPPGEFSTTGDGGAYVKLGAAPDGELFAEVTLDQTYRLDDLLTDVLLAAPSVSIDSASLAGLVATYPGYFAFYLGVSDNLTVADALARILIGIGSWAAIDRLGNLVFGAFTAPAGDPVLSLVRDEGDIISLARPKLPSAIWPPPWRVRLSVEPVHVVVTEFAASVSDTLRSFFSQSYRVVTAEDTGVLDDHPTAQDFEIIDSYFQTVFPFDRNDTYTQATAEAERLLALYDGTRRLYDVTAGRSALRAFIGDVIKITHPRYGLGSGKIARVVTVEHKVDLRGSDVDQVTLSAFG